MAHPNPILVEVTRGGGVESFHRGAVCVADAGGKVVRAWGDADALMCPRSAIKPLQALVLVESGAAEAYGVTDPEIALACASHSGEPVHTEAVAAWLARIGLSAGDLECGAHDPARVESHARLIAAGEKPGALHNNCSGKHAGFLTAALHMGAGTRGYTAPGHPVQKAVMAALASMTGFDAAAAPCVVDGCNAPNIFMPLKALATGWARFGAAAVHGRRWDACRRIAAAMKAHPFMVAGSVRPGVRFITALADSGVAKVGAEGVYCASVPAQGLGVAVKIDDGGARAAGVAMAAVLRRLGAFRPDAEETLAALTEVPIHAWAGAQTGVIRAAQGWPD